MISKNEFTIKETIKDGLCLGCGTCVPLCPNNAIRLQIKNALYIPIIDETKCNDCGICYKVCPGHSIDFDKFDETIFGKKSKDSPIGNVNNCYIGHSNDARIRFDSSSGGFVTQILIFALENKLIDGALVTRFKRNKPLEPEPFIARTREDIIEASKSKYCPVPANIAIDEILKVNGKYAVVGLGCHIQGIRKAEQINKKLRERIVLHIGLFCSHTNNFKIYDVLLNMYNVRKDNVEKMDFRGKGWPGYLTIKSKEKNLDVYMEDYMFIHVSRLITPEFCFLCPDGTSQLADFSAGDAWNIEKNDTIGTSLVISRNEESEKLIQKAIQNNVLQFYKVSIEKMLNTQGVLSYSKIRSVNVSKLIFKLLRKKIKSNKLSIAYTQESKPRLSNYVIYSLLYLNSKILSRDLLIYNKVFLKIPLYILKIERLFFRKILK